MPIPETGFPMKPDETARILATYDDGTSFSAEGPKHFENLNASMRYRTFYLHRNGENLVYQLGEFPIGQL